MQDMQNLIQFNYIRTGERGLRGTDRRPEDDADRRDDRWNSPSSSSSRASPYSRNSEHERYDYGRGMEFRRLDEVVSQKPMSRKEMKRPRYPRRSDSVTSYSPGVHQAKGASLFNLSVRELVSEIVKRLVLMGGTVSMDNLKSSVSTDGLIEEVEALSSDRTLEGLLKDYKETFTVTDFGGPLWQNGVREEVDTTVTYNFNLELCKVNGTKPGMCIGNCKNLHICKFHLMSKCQSMGCKYGHGEEVGHNEDVLRHHYLDRLSREEVTKQLLGLQNRRGLTVPELCTFYSTAKGCNKVETCTFLHLCKFYILDKCEYSLRCRRQHDFSDQHTEKVLRLYGLEGISDKRIKEFLKQAYSDPNGVNKSSRPVRPSLDGAPCPRWIMHGEGRKAHHLLDTEIRQLEEMYREYLDVVQRTITIKGQPVHVNFAKMTARLEGSQWGLQLRRLSNEMIPRS
ncbi:poly [ADP-ribose] polymerase 12-like isoform X2 [Mizuhopecten yessoensis]|uniref:Poly [ADP-ribose] polymerase 12 n=1 Tax=Mizuhopecten yessoensis TaxID=6573 RepID=A0A210Q6P3_MIZYE|nr:poly [ADP-ribose] polymerase 12-like isoform X2 [Mizuhopecten yessoensis]OWF44412.1 Poly [ADP-ribose] polymerase 12 [Mizuhopecten yessoensis]